MGTTLEISRFLLALWDLPLEGSTTVIPKDAFYLGRGGSAKISYNATYQFRI
jgi:hypothetical protein